MKHRVPRTRAGASASLTISVGNGKTAIRGGFWYFYEIRQNNLTSVVLAVRRCVVQPLTLYGGNIDNFATFSAFRRNGVPGRHYSDQSRRQHAQIYSWRV